MSVTINGVARPTTTGANITKIDWHWGDNQATTGWFPQNHTYLQNGNYTVIATATDNNGLTGSATTSVTVVSTPSQQHTPPTVNLQTPSVSGMSVTINGVARPTTTGANITKIDWHWGDNQATTGWFPQNHTYLQNGNYTVIATATDNNGLTGSATTSVTVVSTPSQQHTQPTVNLQTPSVSGMSVTINGVARPTTTGANITKIDWHWGDNQATTGWFPQNHTYLQNGNYTVIATATDNNGLTGSATTSVTVVSTPSQQHTPPTVNLQTPSVSGMSVTINGVARPTTTGANITKIDWHWGDNQATTGWFPQNHTYLQNGNYTVIATATDNNGLTGSATTSVTVVSTPSQQHTQPTVNLQTPSVSGMSVTINGVARPTTTGANITKIDWHWGDNQATTGWFPQNHTYLQNGNYTVIATATDNNGLTGSATTSVTVVSTPSQQHTPPTVNLQTPSVSGMSVTINGVARPTTTGANITKIDWHWGDNQATTGWFPQNHTYLQNGNYTVIATATDNNGLTGSATTSVTVVSTPSQQHTQPTVNLQTPSVSGMSVTINGVARPTTTGANITKIDWHWGDNQATTGWFPQNHTYLQNGNYTVIATATDNNGLTGSATTSVTVVSTPSQQHTPPTVNLQTPSVSGMSVTINGVARPTTTGANITKIDWHWGDNQATTGWFPQNHTYLQNGNYTVIATATDNNGLTGSATTSVTVVSTPSQQHTQPTVNLQTPSVSGMSVTINGVARPTTTGANITKIDWHWGDNQATTGWFPQNHTYLQNGNYTVIATATDNNGLTGSATTSVTISKQPSPLVTKILSPRAQIVAGDKTKHTQ